MRSYSSILRPVAVALCLAGTSVTLFAQVASQNSIQLFSPVNVRASAAGTGYGAAAVNFNSNTLNLTCAASPITAILSSTPDSTGNLLVDNNINVTVTAGQSINGPTNVCVGGVNGSAIGIPFQNCFSSAYEFPPAGVNYIGGDPDNFVAVGGVKPIDISSLLVPGSEQVTISLQDEGFYLGNSTLYLNTNCTQTGVTGPALVSGNPIPSSNPTPDQLAQDFTFNPTDGQGIGFTYDLTAALAAGSLNIVDGTIPEVGDQPLDPAVYQSSFTPGTSFATSNCLVHLGESLPSGQPACKLYTLQCKLATGTDPTGAQCPISSIPNEIFQDQFDGPAFTLPDIGTPSGVTFHQGIGLLMAKEGWTGGPCTFDPASGLADQDCPQNLLTSFSGVTNAAQAQLVAAPHASAKSAVHANSTSSTSSTSSSSSSYSSGGRTTRPNSTFISVAQVPEDLTTVSVAGQTASGWINTPTANVTLSSLPPNLAGTSLPGAASFVASPIQNITYGISPATAVPSPGDIIPTDTTVVDSNGCPTPTNPTSPVASVFTPPVQTLSGLANGRYLIHYYAQDCAGTEELKFSQDAQGNWSTSFYTFPLNVDTVAPTVSAITLSPAQATYALGTPVTSSFSCSDALSGIVRCGTQTYAQGAASTPTLMSPVDTLSPGTKTFSVLAVDAAGNQTTQTLNYTVTGSYDTQIQLTLSPAAITYPSGITATVKLLPGTDPAHAPKGTVQLLDGTTSLATLTLSGAGGGSSATYDYLSALSAGQHTFSAKYVGDGTNPPGFSAPVILNVTPAPVTLSVSCVNPVLPANTPYSCKVYTKPVAAGASGNITYTYDGGPAVSLPLSGGVASFSIAAPATGAHTIVISYAAQGNYAAAPSQTLKFSVLPPK
jgi:hypothetical protein